MGGRWVRGRADGWVGFVVSRGGGGGGTLMFSYIRRLGPCFGVQNFEFQYFWGVSGIFFLEYEDFVDLFGGHHKIDLYLGVISMHFRVFS